ncbi:MULTISPECIES: ketopantoate reductase family protein [Streptomyces]|uniref:ketopantoate reductase family protein n=1 Tax=Streptomyces TaxID=1883 RepID=UPI00099F2A69
MMRVLVVGAGAVGGHFGTLLARAGVDVTFLVRGARADRLRSDGITLVAADGTRTTTSVSTVTAQTLRAPFDVVLLAVKSTAVAAALEDVAPAVGPETSIVPLLNGIGHLDAIGDRFGARHLLGGVCLVATQLDTDGAIRQLTPAASITLGELSGPVTSRVEAITEAFERAPFKTVASTTIEQDMWEKWLFMAAGGAATVLLGGHVGQINPVEDGTDVIRDVIAETASVLEAAGHPARGDALAQVTSTLTSPGSAFATSLYRDFRHNHATEVEPIIGGLCRVAAQHGLSVPLLRAAAVRLRVYEAALA